MEYATIAGNYYTITSKSGCSVTDSTGTLEETVEAGKQLTVQAPSDKLIFDDEHAIVFKANFNFALAGRGTGGGSERLPLGCTRALFLESEGAQFIDTLLTGCDADSFVEFSGVAKGYNGRAFQGVGYALCARRKDHYDFYASVPYDTYVQKKSGYLPETRSLPYHIEAKIVTEKITVNGKTYSIGELKNPSNSDISGYSLKLGAFADGATNQSTWWVGTCERFRAKLANGEINLVPILDPAGIPCMYDTVNGAVFRNAGSGQFILGMTNEQASKLGMALPAGGGELSISLPAGWQENSKVSASLALASVREWDIFPRTTTAVTTASTTFALRRVWVRKIADDRGTYVAADGSRWRVEWCEEVFSSSDPETLGFDRFRSVDAAADYWGLVLYVDPNEDELSTEE